MHAATSDLPSARLFARPSAPVPTADGPDADARLVTEVLATLWDLMAALDAAPEPHAA